MEREVKINGIYRHFKDRLYKVLFVAYDSETLKEVIVYQQLYNNKDVYVRDKEMFMSKVDTDKYPEVVQEYRFELVEE